MRKIYNSIKVFIVLLSVVSIKMNAQNCFQPSQYPSTTIGIASTGTTNITTCNYAGEYSVLNFTAAGSYNFNATGGAGNYLTITDNANNPVGSGYSLLGVVIPSVGIYRCHVSLSPGCGTDATCHNVSVSSATFCNSTSQYPTSTINVASSGTTNVTTCNYGGEYSVNNFTATGVYTITATGGTGNWVTVKNAAGTIIYAQGNAPLVVNIPYTGLFRVHLATSGPTACGTDATCHTVNIVGPAPAGCTGTPAAANSVATPTAICSGANSTLSLSSTYTAGGIAYQWSSASALAGPYTAITGATLSTYAATAVTVTTFYRAVITCTNSAASATATAVQLLVNPNPTVSAVASSTAICFPSTSTVNLTASGATSYTWSPAASLSSSVGAAVVASPTANIVYSIVGNFTTGCSGTATVAVSANPNPSLTATSATVCASNSVAISVASPSFAYCQPAYSTGSGFGDYIGGVQLSTITNTTTGLATPFYTLYPSSANTTATLTAGSTYTLFLNPGTYVGTNVLAAWIDYNKNGALNDLSEKLGEVTVTSAYPAFGTVVFTVPAGAFNGLTRFRVREVFATTNIDPCAGYTYGETEDYFITITGGAEQYNWSPATFLGSTTGSTVVSTPAVSTNYTVSTVVNGCTGSATSSVTANTTSVSITGASSVCAGGTVNLTASGANTYTWNTSANTASISASPSVNTTYTAVGTGTNGCVGSATQAIVVNANPTITVAGGVICSGSSFTLSPSGASTYTFSTGPVVSPSVTSSYSVTGTNSLGCTSANAAVASVTVNTTPAVTAVSSTSLLCVGQTASLTASGAATYTWNTAANTTVIAVSPTVTTSYTVTGSTNGCSNTFTISQAVSPCTGIDAKTASVNGILVYPNPNTGIFTVELNNGSVKNIEVMDLTGRVILSSSSVNDKVDFNINTLANGVYYVRIQSNNTVDVIKIVKE